MTTVERRFTFIIHDDIDLDIEDCLRETPEEAATILALIEDLKDDRELCTLLVEVGHEDEQIRSVKEFRRLQDQRYNAYTVRLYEVDGWRLITAVDYRQRVIALLYIMKRVEDYDDVVEARVIKAYEELGLGKLGR